MEVLKRDEQGRPEKVALTGDEMKAHQDFILLLSRGVPILKAGRMVRKEYIRSLPGQDISWGRRDLDLSEEFILFLTN